MSTTSYSDAALEYVVFEVSGSFYSGHWVNGEIVPGAPFSPTVPETSTCLGGAAMIAFAVAHYVRRKKKRNLGFSSGR